jgi:pimeloyl-ACP methyl ester carboxylesterase
MIVAFATVKGDCMATFVLVHGAWHGSWCWKRVRKALQAEGHEVFTPTLTGVGERSHLASPQVTLDTHIADVVNLIRWEELDDIVLCGHSYGGCVITGVAARVPERLRALLYLDAFILENGQGLHDVLPPELAAGQRQEANDKGHGWLVPPIPAEVFCVNARDSAWVDRQCTPQSLATFQHRVTLLNAPPAAKCTHILATGYEHSVFPPFHALAKSKGWKTLTIDCGHDVMLDRPAELVAILRDAAS